MRTKAFLAAATAIVALSSTQVVQAEETTPSMSEAGLAWAKTPSIRDMDRLYPRRAQVAKVTRGLAVVDCTPDAGGRLACTLVNEEPATMEFGDAALRVMKPATVRSRDGSSPEGKTFRFSLKFGYWPPSMTSEAARTAGDGLLWARMPRLIDYWPGNGPKRGVAYVIDLDCIADAEGAPVCVQGEDTGLEPAVLKSAIRALSEAKVKTTDGASPEGKAFRYRSTFTAD